MPRLNSLSNELYEELSKIIKMTNDFERQAENREEISKNADLLGQATSWFLVLRARLTSVRDDFCGRSCPLNITKEDK